LTVESGGKVEGSEGGKERKMREREGERTK